MEARGFFDTVQAKFKPTGIPTGHDEFGNFMKKYEYRYIGQGYNGDV